MNFNINKPIKDDKEEPLSMIEAENKPMSAYAKSDEIASIFDELLTE